MIHVDWKPDKKKLGGFAIVSVVAFGALGMWCYLGKDILNFEAPDQVAETVGMVLGGLAIYSVICRGVDSRGMIPIYYVLTVISVPIGFMLSHIIMGFLFYIIFTPIALYFRLIRRDVLNRRFEPEAATYWNQRPSHVAVKRYFRQF